MEKIDYKKIGEYFSEKATSEFGGYYSTDTRDWEEDISQAWSNAYYDEEEDIYSLHIEITKNGKQPLLINFYAKTFDDNTDNEYYI